MLDFIKAHAYGNDFLFIARDRVGDLDVVTLARRLCDRHIGVGADGLIVEVHPCPEKAVSDGAQSLTLADFARMMSELKPYIRLWKEARARELAAV